MHLTAFLYVSLETQTSRVSVVIDVLLRPTQTAFFDVQIFKELISLVGKEDHYTQFRLLVNNVFNLFLKTL